jgi:hypothetical protein
MKAPKRLHEAEAFEYFCLSHVKLEAKVSGCVNELDLDRSQRSLIEC